MTMAFDQNCLAIKNALDIPYRYDFVAWLLGGDKVDSSSTLTAPKSH
jgi:hypothetical protein